MSLDKDSPAGRYDPSAHRMLSFHDAGKNKGRIDLVHLDVPKGDYKGVTEGWDLYYWTPCWHTLDPASLLITSHFNEDITEIPSDWLAQEYYEDDVNNLAAVARSARGISTLHDATSGDPTSSPRWHANMEMGGDQELLMALRTRGGDPWASLGLYREPGDPLFSDEEIGFLTAAAPFLGEGAQRAAVGVRYAVLGQRHQPAGKLAR